MKRAQRFFSFFRNARGAAPTTPVMKLNSLVIAAAFGAVGLASSTARAETCATLEFPGTGGQEIIIGEFAAVISHPIFGEALVPSGEVGVCWRDQTNGWTIAQPTTTVPVGGSTQTITCDTATPGGDTLFLSTGAGDDTVTTLLYEHTSAVGGSNWINNHSGTGMICGSGDYAIMPWNGGFDFGVEAVLGTGEDRFFGTPNDDSAKSNKFFSIQVPIPAPHGPLRWVQLAPGDDAMDFLCGGDGSDVLLGDADDGAFIGGEYVEEVLDGGFGDDYCDGDPFNWGGTPGGSAFDVARHVAASDYGCDTIERATTPLVFSGGWSMVEECWAIDNPVDYFGL